MILDILLQPLRAWRESEDEALKRDAEREYRRLGAIIDRMKHGTGLRQNRAGRFRHVHLSDSDVRMLAALQARKWRAFFYSTYGEEAEYWLAVEAERSRMAEVLARGGTAKHICPQCGEAFDYRAMPDGKVFCRTCNYAKNGAGVPCEPRGHWEPASTDIAGVRTYKQVWNNNP